MELTISIENVPTPRGLQYWTPSEASENQTPGSTSFQDHQIQSPEAIPRWTTAPESSHQLTTQRLCLGWNGLTKEGAMQLFKNAQEDDQLGRSDDAEQKFQQVLIALDNLLPPNHPDANSVAYTLAAFYARHHRMKEADDILDKMTQRQAECNGIGNKAMTDHVLRVVNLLNSWYRPEDALAFLEKASYYLGRGEAQISLSSNPVVSNTAPPQRQQSIDNSNSCIAPEQSQILINDQMNSTVSKAIIRDESAESLLLKIIEQCDGNVTISASQNMRARSQLIEFYHKADKVSDALSHLSKANTLFHSIWTYNVTITKDLMEASTILVSRYLKSAQYETADHMFHTMQICVANVCGPHHSFTIWLLIQIGIIYQHEHRWSNAEARFEQALAASMTANGLCDPQTKALEEALENGYYSEMELEASNFRTTLASQGVLVNPAIQQLVI
jgi:tetratricopeptide (TPR) repeat protein